MVDGLPFLVRLLRYWQSRGVPHLPGVTDSDILAFEERNEINLPAEVRAFYSKTNGTEVPGTEGTDDKQFDFWPLEDVHFVEGETSMMYFADVLQYSVQFAFEVIGNNDAGNGSVFAVSGGLIKVASSFAQFIDMYITDHETLYPRDSWKKRGLR